MYELVCEKGLDNSSMEQPVEEEQTLGELFRFCALECQNLEKGKKGEVELHEVQSKCSALLQCSQSLTSFCSGNIRRCLMKVNSLGLFSPNEDKDDILTSHLKFLCVSKAMVVDSVWYSFELTATYSVF